MSVTSSRMQRFQIPRVAMVFTVIACLWLILNGSDLASWVLGLPAVAVATLIAMRLIPDAGRVVRPAGLVAFAFYFAWQSLSGGFDVARRAFRKHMPLNPVLLGFVPRLPAGSPRWFFCACACLLPGTSVLEIRDALIQVHLLDAESDSEARLRRLEERVAALFGVVLPDHGVAA